MASESIAEALAGSSRRLRASPPEEPETHDVTAEGLENVRLRAAEPVATIVTMSSFGAFFVLALVRYFLPAGVSEVDERRLYLLTGAFGPAFALAAGWLWFRARRAFFRDSIVFPFATALANVLFWAVGLFAYKRAISMAGTAQLEQKTSGLAVLFLALNAVTFAACLAGRRVRLSPAQRQVVRRLVDDGYCLVPIAAAFAVGEFSNYNLQRWTTLVFLGLCGLPALVGGGLRLRTGKWTPWLFDIAAVVLIVGSLFNAGYPFDEHHYGFYLGPVASLIGGRRPLVDVNCQYGVGVVYFLAAFFKLHIVPLAYQGMSAVLSVLGIIQFGVVYALLRLCLRSRHYCLLALVVMIAVRVFAGPHTYVRFPSLGPLRFIWGYLLLLCVALRERYPERAKTFRALEAAVVGVTSVWSAETFAGTLATSLGVLGYETWFGPGRLSHRMLDAGKRLLATLVAIGAMHALLAADIRLHTGEWPHWSHYFAYLSLYSSIGFWAMPITTWEPWAPVVLIYGASFVALFARRPLFGRTEIKLEHKIAWGMTILGMVEFSHYIGRSHIEHLRIYLADIFLAAYWLDRTATAPFLAEGFRKSFLACSYAAVGLVLLSALPGFSQKYGETLFGRVALDQPITSPWGIDRDAPWRGSARGQLRDDAVRLMRKYQPEKRRVALFMDPFLRPIALLYVEKALVWPLSLPQQDEAEPTAKARILSYPDGLQAGDFIFVSDGISAVEQELLGKLKKRFQFSDVESTGSGLKAVRLDPLAP